jgi:hypothetical protein
MQSVCETYRHSYMITTETYCKVICCNAAGIRSMSTKNIYCDNPPDLYIRHDDWRLVWKPSGYHSKPRWITYTDSFLCSHSSTSDNHYNIVIYIILYKCSPVRKAERESIISRYRFSSHKLFKPFGWRRPTYIPLKRRRTNRRTRTFDKSEQR